MAEQIDSVPWEPQPGQCLLCGGRGGWWSGQFRDACTRCHGSGWDPDRAKAWFVELVEPLQRP